MDTTKLVSAAVASSGAVLIAFHSIATIVAIAIGPAIVFVSSLVVGFTDYPTTKSVLDVILRLLNFVSLLVHRNSPGTFKPPFVNSDPPTNTPKAPTIQIGHSSAITALGVWLALSLVACAHLPVPLQQAIDCAQQSLAPAIQSALQDVATALGGAVDWSAQLDGAVVKWGLDAVVCAVTELANDLTHSASRTEDEEAALVNARAWLAGQSKKAK